MRKILGDWNRATLSLPEGSLSIYTPPGAERWREVVLDYLRGAVPGLVPVKSAPDNRVERGEVAGIPGTYFFKWYGPKGWTDRMRQTLRGSRALRACVRGNELMAAGFHSPEPVCVAEIRKGGVVRGSVFITREIPDAPAMREWINAEADFFSRHWKNPVSQSPAIGKLNLLQAFAAELARLHAAGLRHADARLRNILCRHDEQGWHFYWLDNEGNRRRPADALDVRLVRNLVQVNMDRKGLSVADRLRFWNSYARAARLKREEARALRNKVAKITRDRWKERGWL